MMKRGLVIGCAATLLFSAGWWAARLQPADRSKAENPGQISIDGVASEASAAVSEQRRADGVSERSKLVATELRSALQGAAPARTPGLLAALEKITTTELTSELIAVMDRIMESGDLEECHYLLSVMEQREDRDGVRFLVKQLEHPDEDIRDRALISCESVAGKIFDTPEKAKEWASDWTPDPQKQALFSQRMPDDPSATPLGPGPRSKTREKESGLFQEQDPSLKEK